MQRKGPCHCYLRKDKRVALIKTLTNELCFFSWFQSAVKGVVTSLTKLTRKWLNWKLVFPLFLLRTNGTWQNVLAVLSALLHLLQLIFLCLALYYLSPHCNSETPLYASSFHSPLSVRVYPHFWRFSLRTNMQHTCNRTHDIPHPARLMSLVEGCAPSPPLPALIWSLIGWGSCQIWCMIGCLLLPGEMALVLWEQDLITGAYERAMEEWEIKGHRKR